MNTIQYALISIFLIVSFSAIAQKNNIQNAANALKFNELDKAKKAIDLAAEHQETKGDKKMWYYRGKTYRAINDDTSKFKNLDPDAADKSYISYLNLLKIDKENTYKDEITPFLIGSALRLYNKGILAFQLKETDKATRYLISLFEVFQYDKDKSLQRNNITPESLNYNLYLISNSIKDNIKAAEYLQKLIDVKYKNPAIYLEMSRIKLEAKDTVKALSYIDLGRNLFDDNADLIKAELNIYILQNKMNILLEKINKAIETTPDNEMLYYIQAKVYEQKSESEKAELSFKKAIELKSDYGQAIRDIGTLYFNKAVEWKKKGDNASANELNKIKEYDAKAELEFKNALPYLEKTHELNPSEAVIIQSLLKIYRITGDTDKYDKLKSQLKK